MDSSDDGEQKTEDGKEIAGDVQEGEVVESSIETQTQQSSSQDTTILESLTSLIRENLAKVAKLQNELKQQKEMLDSVLANDETYKQHSEAAKAAVKLKSATKSEIVKRPEVGHTAEKVKALSVEIKESKESLNSYLPEYQRLSGSNEIDDENGEPMQIVYQARLVRRRA